MAREEKKNYAPINVMPAGAGEAGHGGGDLTFSKIFNQMPCPRANQSSQNNNSGHKGGPSKNSFVKRAGHHILQEQLTGATRRIPPVPSPPLKINGPLPPPPPYRIPHQRHQCSSVNRRSHNRPIRSCNGIQYTGTILC